MSLTNEDRQYCDTTTPSIKGSASPNLLGDPLVRICTSPGSINDKNRAKCAGLGGSLEFDIEDELPADDCLSPPSSQVHSSSSIGKCAMSSGFSSQTNNNLNSELRREGGALPPEIGLLFFFLDNYSFIIYDLANLMYCGTKFLRNVIFELLTHTRPASGIRLNVSFQSAS